MSREDMGYVVLWLLASVIAAAVAMAYLPASLVDGQFIPVGNDSFYHARRILDAAVGERGFYQYDTMIHVPEGSWLTWPWAYDYFMALSLKAALLIAPGTEPMKFLAYVPVFWTLVNLGLYTLICREIGLRAGMTAIALLAVCLAGVTQSLHAVGVIDHHFIELSFVLMAVLFGLRVFRSAAATRDAVLFGVVLGIAPAFHNSLFILQIPVIAAAVFTWLRKDSLDSKTIVTFASALVGSCLLFLLPSETFRAMHFDYETHSWFHLYIAACTAIAVVLMSKLTYSPRNIGILAAVAVLLAVPILLQVGKGLSFLQGESIRLGVIAEVKSPLQMYLDSGDAIDVVRLYSWLVVFAPLLIGVALWRLLSERALAQVYFFCFAAFGLALLLMQYRLHPFGYWALILVPLLLANSLLDKGRGNPVAVGVACLLIVAIAYQPTLRHQLLKIPPAGLTQDYAATRSLYPVLADACASDPGVVLSYADDGHPVRYHSDCSVIVNNFLLTPQHGEKVLQSEQLMRMTPEQLLSAEPSVKYVFVRLYGLFKYGVNGGLEPTPLDELAAANMPLFVALIARDSLPGEFELLGELRVQDDRDIAFARVYKINRP